MTIKKSVLRYACVLMVVLAIPTMAAAENNGVRYYVSLGTSLSVGIQPDASGENQETDEGYADQLFDIIEPNFRRIRLVKLGCPGETTMTMMVGGKCAYDEGSQLAQAVQFLHAHKDKVELITIDMGVNDILAAGCIVGTDVNVPCILGAIGQIANNLPSTPIRGMNYYNTFLAFWLTGPEGRALAETSAGLASFLNQVVLGPTYAGFGIPVADVAAAFLSDNVTLVPFPLPAPNNLVPLNVATICALTYMCVPAPIGPNIHSNPSGYGVIAATFAATLP